MDPKNIFGNNAAGTDNNAVSFEELENAFGTPTQMQAGYEEKEPPVGGGIPRTLTDPDGDALRPAETEEEEDVSPERAQRTGERIARLVDTGIDFALSNFVAHNNETYRADEKDLQDIAECWGEISQERGWSIGPEWSLVILYLMVYGPLVKQAFTDRRISQLEEAQRRLEQRMDTYDAGGRPQPTVTVEPTPKPKPDGTAEDTQYNPIGFVVRNQGS